MAQKVTVQEAPQEQLPQQLQPQEAPQQAAPQQPQEQPQEAATPLLEAFRLLLERFKASEKGFEFSIQFSPQLELPSEEFENLVKSFDSVNFVEFGKVTFAEFINVIAIRQSGPRCLREQKRVTVAFRLGYGRTVLIDYVHGRRETVPAKCS